MNKIRNVHGFVVYDIKRDRYISHNYIQEFSWIHEFIVTPKFLKAQKVLIFPLDRATSVAELVEYVSKDNRYIFHMISSIEDDIILVPVNKETEEPLFELAHR